MIFLQRFGVYHWQAFPFSDGSDKDKYFIALNCTLKDQQISLVLPTSRYEKYQGNSIYLRDTVIIEEATSQYFHKKTVIDLKNIQNLAQARIQQAIVHGKVNYLGLLETKFCQEIEKIIENSMLLSPIHIAQLLCREVVNAWSHH